MPLIASSESRTRDGVQPAPLPGGEHPRVDLQMQVPVRIAGAGGVVPHRHRLQPLDRDGDLRAARTDPGGRVLGEPADDLRRGAVLRRLIGRRDIGMQLRRERPRLRPVHRHLDEPHRPRVGAQPAASARPVSGSSPATHASYPSPVSDASSTTGPSGAGDEPPRYPVPSAR